MTAAEDSAHTPDAAGIDLADIVDVVVVGAGPTGLLLAGDLAAAGLSVTLVERRPRTAANLTRAFAVHARTLELLDARGLADELVSTGSRIDRLRPFNGMPLTLQRLRSRYPFVLITPQYETEKLLERRALSTGADIQYDWQVTGLHQDHDLVTLDLRRTDDADRRTDADAGTGTDTGTDAASGATTRRLHARHVVGADGVRSTVRRSLGLPFPGQAVVRSMVLADVRLTDPPEDLLAVNGTADAFAFLVPFGDGWYRAIAWHRDARTADTDPVDLEELRALARTALGTDHGMHDPRWMSRFHSDERQVPRYRVGRVFLAGDAAHVHSPAGGLGMNTGLQDAANLSWKLAAVLHGQAPDPETLLDSYHRERHPVGRFVLRASGALVRAVMADSPARRTARTLGAAFIARVGPAQDRALGMISGIGISYPPPPGTRRPTPAGRRAPDVPLAGGQRLYAALRTGGFVLITPPGAATPPGAPLTHHHWATRPRTARVLVRPDGYVAWSAPRATDAETAAAVATWLLPHGKDPHGKDPDPGDPQKA
ncbi:FAD-dependent monooxygenase [Streptomyces sp. NBC_00249]|uniref:FAD-dependent monooxygenase n=1 Tax=Streptomyces sp. NBC_00249 TaxID=2975690 RepID=UPI002252CB5B|nr:FAD-dependent monooxygenase [Streptomyces sp. NBC_00249]MCX5199110.1 FAD-dependent monooxygenase [Streptomyces sp. NBC_00249]